MKAENLINWGELSRLLTGSRLNIRKNRIPKKHAAKVEAIKAAIQKELDKIK